MVRSLSTRLPATAVSPADGSISVDALGTLGKLVVPFGGLLRGRLTPGEVLVVIGATGSFGSAAVLLGCALGAERVVAAGRTRQHWRTWVDASESEFIR
jgi:alcohol dehydrogenase